jgi:photosystem II stability/assembly factor-like uncharacterized protein
MKKSMVLILFLSGLIILGAFSSAQPIVPAIAAIPTQEEAVPALQRAAVHATRTWTATAGQMRKVTVPEYGSRAASQFVTLNTADSASRPVSQPALWSKASVDLSTSGWQPYPIYGGEMLSLAMNPSNSQTIYVGTRAAGVFKTIDGGQFWQPARNELTFMPTRSLAIDPLQPNVLYAGTDFDGIWKSTDGANSWFKSSTGLDESQVINQLVIDPQNPAILYAGLLGGGLAPTGNIYKSTDAGATWTMKDNGLPRYYAPKTYSIDSLIIDPAQTSVLYTITYSGTYMTSNGGDSWSSISGGLPHDSAGQPYEVMALNFDPNHAGRLSAILSGEYYEGQYYIFQNGQWQQVSNQSSGNSLDADHLAFYPNNPNIIYSAGTLYFGKSADSGATWNKYNIAPQFESGGCLMNQASQIRQFVVPPASPDTIIAASEIFSQTFRGLYRSVNQGTTWSDSTQGITAVVIYSTVIDPQNSNYLYAGDNQGYLYRSLDGGVTWQTIPVYPCWGPQITQIVIDPANSQNIYTIAGLYLYKSSDQGDTFNRDDAVENPNSLVISASNALYAATSYHGILKSTDAGQTWNQKNQGVPYCYGSEFCRVMSLALDPKNPETIWAGTSSGGIIKSTNGGDNWQVKGFNDPINVMYVNMVSVDPENGDKILAGVYPGGKIYKSIDGGDSWQLKLSGIADVMKIVFDPRNSNWVYAATEGYGVLQSYDGGETWHDYSNGIFYPVDYSISISNDDPPLLIAGSYSSGLYGMHPAAPKMVFLPLLRK